MLKRVALALLAGWLATGAAADPVYKCLEGGKPIFTDQPCGAKSTGIAIHSTGEERPTTAAQPPSMSALAENNRRADLRVKRQILVDDIWRAELKVTKLKQEMDESLAALRYKKLYASNNLAGAVWEQSISDEMRAVSSSYETKIGLAQGEVDTLKREMADIDRDLARPR